MTLTYKGYAAEAELDLEAEIIHGRVIDLSDVITFQAKFVGELEKAFHDSVDEYLAICAELGQSPDKPYAGKILVRLSSSLHRRLAVAASKEGRSLNETIVARLDSSFSAGYRAHPPTVGATADTTSRRVKGSRAATGQNVLRPKGSKRKEQSRKTKDTDANRTLQSGGPRITQKSAQNAVSEPKQLPYAGTTDLE